jgi:hypothetical protein
MGYSKNERGEVVLTMSVNDYENLLLALGYAGGAAAGRHEIALFRNWLGLANRLNEGNARFTPYAVSEEKQGVMSEELLEAKVDKSTWGDGAPGVSVREWKFGKEQDR